LEREMAMRNWRKTGTVVFSGLFFLWLLSFGGAKESNIKLKKKGCPFEDTLMNRIINWYYIV
jgi:hypothetical protein